jgi:uncharacterized membrane protein YfcA
VSALDAVAILLAAFAAGGINAVVGSGTLITFPLLVGLGYPPLVANMSNNVGLAPGGLSGAIGYHRELAGQRPRVIRLGTASCLGGAVGATLLLTLPASAFRAVVPVFIAMALVLVVLQPRLGEALTRQHESRPHGGALVFGVVFAVGVYGGYFGGAQGIVLVAALALLLNDHLQRINGLKNVLVTLVNSVAGVAFILFGTLDWGVVGLIAVGSIVGGQFGSHFGRRLPEPALRALIVVVGSFAIVKLWLG